VTTSCTRRCGGRGARSRWGRGWGPPTRADDRGRHARRTDERACQQDGRGPDRRSARGRRHRARLPGRARRRHAHRHQDPALGGGRRRGLRARDGALQEVRPPQHRPLRRHGRAERPAPAGLPAGLREPAPPHDEGERRRGHAPRQARPLPLAPDRRRDRPGLRAPERAGVRRAARLRPPRRQAGEPPHRHRPEGAAARGQRGVRARRAPRLPRRAHRLRRHPQPGVPRGLQPRPGPPRADPAGDPLLRPARGDRRGAPAGRDAGLHLRPVDRRLRGHARPLRHGHGPPALQPPEDPGRRAGLRERDRREVGRAPRRDRAALPGGDPARGLRGHALHRRRPRGLGPGLLPLPRPAAGPRAGEARHRRADEARLRAGHADPRRARRRGRPARGRLARLPALHAGAREGRLGRRAPAPPRRPALWRRRPVGRQDRRPPLGHRAQLDEQVGRVAAA
jgi:hypothetical protein